MRRRPRLVPGRTGSQGEPVELWLINRGMRGRPPCPSPRRRSREETGEERGRVIDSAFDYEARLIARRIGSPNETIPDKGVPQPIRYRDIAILLRSGVRRASSRPGSWGRRASPPIRTRMTVSSICLRCRDVINLLKVLDNPYDDETLLAALSSHAFRFTPAELTDIRKHQMDPGVPLHRNFFEMADHHPRVRDAAQRFARWRFLAENMPLERLCGICCGTPASTLAGARLDGELRRQPAPAGHHGSLPRPIPSLCTAF